MNAEVGLRSNIAGKQAMRIPHETVKAKEAIKDALAYQY